MAKLASPDSESHARAEEALAPFEGGEAARGRAVAPGAPPVTEPRDATRDEWSVLASPPPGLADDVREALRALGPARRGELSRKIGKAVLEELKRTIDPWFSSGMRDHADVDVYGASGTDGALVLYFVADHDNYNFAQSGSDWDDHYLYAGAARVARGTIQRLTFALERHVHLTEHEHEDYSPRALRDLLRDELLATWSGRRADRAAFDAAVTAVRAASEARARAAQAAAVARDPPATPRARTARCPKCASGEIDREPLFDAYSLTCGRCAHRETFETYPDPDPDDHWYA